MKQVKKYVIDKKLSKEMYMDFANLIRMKGCFDNVYNIVQASKMWCNPKYKGYKICYGAWSVSNNSNMYAKHCFFIKDGKIVDPTHYTTTDLKRDYLVFKSLTPKDYLELISMLNGDISYTRELNKIQMDLYTNGIVLIG